MDLYSKIKSLQKDVVLPAKEDLRDLLLRVNKILECEDSLFDSVNYRPQNKRKAPGGLLDFKDDITTIIVPDLHARVDFIPSLLDFKLEIHPDPIADIMQRYGFELNTNLPTCEQNTDKLYNFKNILNSIKLFFSNLLSPIVK